MRSKSTCQRVDVLLDGVPVVETHAEVEVVVPGHHGAVAHAAEERAAVEEVRDLVALRDVVEHTDEVEEDGLLLGGEAEDPALVLEHPE